MLQFFSPPVKKILTHTGLIMASTAVATAVHHIMGNSYSYVENEYKKLVVLPKPLPAAKQSSSNDLPRMGPS
jgi:hypothetical protein